MLYLAEFYLPRHASLAEVARRARGGARAAASSGADIRLIRVIFVPRDESCFALHVAGSSEEVMAAGELAGLVFDRVGAADTAP
jgi:hypothetical protein